MPIKRSDILAKLQVTADLKYLKDGQQSPYESTIVDGVQFLPVIEPGPNHYLGHKSTKAKGWILIQTNRPRTEWTVMFVSFKGKETDLNEFSNETDALKFAVQALKKIEETGSYVSISSGQKKKLEAALGMINDIVLEYLPEQYHLDFEKDLGELKANWYEKFLE